MGDVVLGDVLDVAYITDQPKSSPSTTLVGAPQSAFATAISTMPPNATTATAQPWRPPPEVRVSGSVVRNSMTLLPTDGDVTRGSERANKNKRDSTGTRGPEAPTDKVDTPSEPDREHGGESESKSQSLDVPSKRQPSSDAIEVQKDHEDDVCVADKTNDPSFGSIFLSAKDATCAPMAPDMVLAREQDDSVSETPIELALADGQTNSSVLQTSIDESAGRNERTGRQRGPTESHVAGAVLGVSRTPGEEQRLPLPDTQDCLPTSIVRSASEGKDLPLSEVPISDEMPEFGGSDQLDTRVNKMGVLKTEEDVALTSAEDFFDASSRPHSSIEDFDPTVTDRAMCNGERVEDNHLLGSNGDCSVVEPLSPPECQPSYTVQAHGEGAEERITFFPCDSFTDAKAGYVFKLADRGLGYYVDGYIDRRTKAKSTPSHRPWNAGPGDEAIRRGAMGPVRKYFKKVDKLRDRQSRKDTEESDTRPFMARMVAQKNSRGFQSTLFGREHVLDEHILALLDKFADPSVFKKKHGYNIHGQMLGKDGKMIVKVRPEKTEEEKAQLSWYRKVYEDRLGKHLPTKRLGDSIEARREAYAYSRHFTAELNGREMELDKSLVKALKGQTKLEFITEDYHYPGAYDTDGKVILQKGAAPSNELHYTDEQKERACSYRFKAIQRFRAAHDDVIGAISKKDKALQKMFKKTDASILEEIASEAVTGSGMGIYRQTKRSRQDGEPAEDSSFAGPTQSPEQLRDDFSHSLKVQIKGKDKALMKEVAGLDEDEAEQMIDDLGQGVEVAPGSWRQDPAGLRRVQRRRKELIAEIEADRRKVVCPWRPGGMHIAQEPWQSFIPRSHRPVRSASEGVAATEKEGGTGGHAAHGVGDHKNPSGSGGARDRTGARRPHTAPAYRRKEFMGSISARATRILAAEAPGTPLHRAFSVYSADPFPLEPAHRPSDGTRSNKTVSTAGGESKPNSPLRPRGSGGAGLQQRAWEELSGSVFSAERSLRHMTSAQNSRPLSAVIENSRRVRATPRRPSTACGSRNPSVQDACYESTAAKETVPTDQNVKSLRVGPGDDLSGRTKESEARADLQVQSGPGITMLWARLCRPSDSVFNNSVCPPSQPRTPNSTRPNRRRARNEKSPTTSTTSATLAGTVRDASVADTQVSKECHAGQPGSDKNSSLERLEGVLDESSWRRVMHRKHVFRGYAESSRMARTWDPGSPFFAEGATRHFVQTLRPSQDACNEWEGRSGTPAPGSGGTVACARLRRREKRYRRMSTAIDVELPVEMEWNEVDVVRFIEAADEIKAALETKLIAVVTNDGDGSQMSDSFQQAQELVKSAGALLGCPQDVEDRFDDNMSGEVRIGNYVAMVSRLNLFWIATCGVVEIIAMARARDDFLEVFRSEAGPSAKDGIVAEDSVGDHWQGVSPATRADLPRHASVWRYEKRLELAEYSVAVAASVKMWLAIVPWRVRVMYHGEPILSRLRAEEELLGWPASPEPVLDSGEDVRLTTAGALDEISMPVYDPHGPNARFYAGVQAIEGLNDRGLSIPEEEPSHHRPSINTPADDSGGKCPKIDVGRPPDVSI